MAERKNYIRNSYKIFKCLHLHLRIFGFTRKITLYFENFHQRHKIFN